MSEKTESPPKPSTKKRLSTAEIFSLIEKGQLNPNIPPLPPGYPDPNKEKDEVKR